MSSGRRTAAALALGAGIVALLGLRFLRRFPWPLAAIAGLAVGVFAAAAWRTGRELAALWRGDRR